MCAAADRGFTWSDEETSALLKFWGEHDPQNAAPGNKRNFVIYETIAEKMATLGFNRSTSQCREKIKRMKREYTLTKQFNGSTSGPKKLMRFYDQFERVLIEKQNRNQRCTTLRNKAFTSSGLHAFPAQNHWSRQNSKRNSKRPHAFGSVDEKCEPDPWAPDVVLIEGNESVPSSSAETSQHAASRSSSLGDPPSKKKKKIASRMAMFQSMMDAITTKFMSYQEQTDSRFLEQLEILEQERLEADESLQKMWIEFEEKRRKDEQEHEMRVLSTFKDILTQIKVNHISKPS